MTISTDKTKLLENECRTAVGAGTCLSDPGRRLQTDLDIAEYTELPTQPMIPRTLALEPGMRVYKIYKGYWFFRRPTLDLCSKLRTCCNAAVPMGAEEE